jgi:cellulose synthase/poly-beta-1,6-N-acetylglucosamine synthase-like glycosyltransferase
MIVALIPAHNEAGSIGRTLQGLTWQTHVPERIVVIANGCTDDTADVARGFDGVTVLELPALPHRKSEALNRGWSLFGRDADMVICLDADTFLPSNAVADWWEELDSDPGLGGSSSKFTMQGSGLLVRLQKAESSAWTDIGLRRGSTRVLSGTGCALRGSALRDIAARDDREGPWSYRSATEDFELTYRIREAGWRCQVSPTVRAYTDSMKTVKALWGQRMKWQVGTVEDLLAFGVNRLTMRDWWQQALGLFTAFIRILAVVVLVGYLTLGGLTFVWWWFLLPLLVVALDVKRSLRIPHRDWKDVLMAASFFPNELFMWLRTGWFFRSWFDVLVSRVTGTRKDRWAAQYKAERVGVI